VCTSFTGDKKVDQCLCAFFLRRFTKRADRIVEQKVVAQNFAEKSK
jgi:hypothetical protein